MHINFDDDKIEVKDIFEPKKTPLVEEDSLEKEQNSNNNDDFLKTDDVEFKSNNSTDTENKDDFFGTNSDDSKSENSEKEEIKDDFFGETEKSKIKNSGFEKEKEEEKKEVSSNIEYKKDESIEMEKYIDELKSGLDKIYDESQNLKTNCQGLKDENKVSFENVKTEFEKVKGQIKGNSEEIKSELDNLKDNIKHSAQDIKLSLSKAKLDIIDDDKKEQKGEEDKKALFSKKASMDSLFRVVFLLVILTLATVVYFGITIMEDFNKNIGTVNDKIVNLRGSISGVKVVKQSPQNRVVSSNIDTTKFENEARVIKNQISNLTKNINELKNILNIIKNQKQTMIVSEPLPIPIPTIVPTQKEQKTIVQKIDFDDSNLNDKLNILSKELERITTKLNSINSKINGVGKDMKAQTKVVINKLDRVNRDLQKKIDAKEVKPIKIYSDGLQIRGDQ